MEYEHVSHTFGPVFDERSRILILGSFPSVKSREQNFYYGHPQNRFWRVLSACVGRMEPPVSTVEKKEFLLQNGIALWDVIESCDIVGSSDSSIKNVTPNDMDIILNHADIRKIIANGDKAYRLYLKYCRREGRPEPVKLPSTSPANAAAGLERLTEIWSRELAGVLNCRAVTTPVQKH